MRGLVAIVIYLLLWWIIRSAKKQAAYVEGDALVFPVARSVRLVGICGAVFFGALVFFSHWGVFKEVTWWTTAILCVFALLGLWVSVGEIVLDTSHIEKRFLWRKKSIPLADVVALRRTWDGRILVCGTQSQISFSPYYADSERLMKEIQTRAPALIRR